MKQAEPASAVLAVRVHPRAARDEVGPLEDGVLHVRVTRPPADGAANDAVRRLLAGWLGVAPSRLSLIAGERARVKRFEVRGTTAAQLSRLLAGVEGRHRD